MFALFFLVVAVSVERVRARRNGQQRLSPSVSVCCFRWDTTESVLECPSVVTLAFLNKEKRAFGFVAPAPNSQTQCAGVDAGFDTGPPFCGCV